MEVINHNKSILNHSTVSREPPAAATAVYSAAAAATTALHPATTAAATFAATVSIAFPAAVSALREMGTRGV